MSDQSLSEILNFVDAFNIDSEIHVSKIFIKKICKADLNIVFK